MYTYDITNTSQKRMAPKVAATPKRLNIARIITVRPGQGWTETASWPVSPRADYARMRDHVGRSWDYYPGSRIIVTDLEGHMIWVGRL